MMRVIQLSREMVAIVDDADFEWLSQWKWSVSKTRNGWRAERKQRNRELPGFHYDSVLMHRFIMNAPKGVLVDHWNGNSLDNRRENLRLCTNRQNTQNSRLHKNNKTGFKGVIWLQRYRKYQANIRIGDKQDLYLGRFDTPEEAAHAYDEAARKHHREFAYLNFPATAQ